MIRPIPARRGEAALKHSEAAEATLPRTAAGQSVTSVVAFLGTMVEESSTNISDPGDVQPPTDRARKAPVPKTRRVGRYRVPPRERRHGLLVVNTGDGKGKTTAALGILLRATGRGMRVAMFQFIKSRADLYGEHVAAAQLGVDIVPLGEGFTWLSGDVAADRALAEDGWRLCHEALEGGKFDVLIFDELTYPLSYGWLDTETVIAAIRARPAGTHVVVTGRNAPDALLQAADLVTEMRLLKHPYRDQGIGAQPGIEL